VEQEVQAHLFNSGHELLAAELARDDVEAEEITVNGSRYQLAGVSPETYLTPIGPVTVERHVYRPAHVVERGLSERRAP
jgi:hypothetical protein